MNEKYQVYLNIFRSEHKYIGGLPQIYNYMNEKYQVYLNIFRSERKYIGGLPQI